MKPIILLYLALALGFIVEVIEFIIIDYRGYFTPMTWFNLIGNLFVIGLASFLLGVENKRGKKS